MTCIKTKDCMSALTKESLIDGLKRYLPEASIGNRKKPRKGFLKEPKRNI